MNNYFSLVFMLLAILLLGIGMLKAVRWSRKKNADLRKKQQDSQELALRKIRNGEDLRTTVTNYFTSSVSKSEDFIGKALAIGVILFFISFALLVGYFVWVRI